jgi:ABC-2 type transport system ATP-binding protein
MAALRRLDSDGVQVLDVGLRRPTLDDVFLTLTGHAAEVSDTDSVQAAVDGKHGDGERPTKPRTKEPAR